MAACDVENKSHQEARGGWLTCTIISAGTCYAFNSIFLVTYRKASLDTTTSFHPQILTGTHACPNNFAWFLMLSSDASQPQSHFNTEHHNSTFRVQPATPFLFIRLSRNPST